MRPFAVSLSLAAFGVFSLVAEEPLPEGAKTNRGHTTQDADRVFYDLKGKLTWELAGQKIAVKVEGENVDFLSEEGKVIYRITAPHHLDGMVVSEDGTVIVLLTTRSDRFSPFYHSLVRLERNESGQVISTELLPGSAEGFNDSDRWISKIGAVSNDGRFVLVEMSRPHKHDEERTSFFYDWELWDTQEVKMVRRGLRVPDAKGEDNPGVSDAGPNPPRGD